MQQNEINASNPDYIVIGSGLSGLAFAALAAKSGKIVHVLEAHDCSGGYGHTFQMGRSARFNAQLHYVWNCGENETVNLVLKQLGLHELITFERFDSDGFDRMFIPGHQMKIPADNSLLIQRLTDICPEAEQAITQFIHRVVQVAIGLDLIASKKSLRRVLKDGLSSLVAASYRHATLQDVFDQYSLPLAVQSILASQWPDFLLPPKQLSFFAWVMLFTGYQRGAYYPTHHFEHVIEALVDVIRANGSRVEFNQEVDGFLIDRDKIKGVTVTNRCTDEHYELTSKTVVANMDPKRASQMIGIDKFSPKVQSLLDYEYSPSNFMIYCTLKDIDLTKFGFGKWNTFHSGHDDLNEAYAAMYERNNYSNPSFAMTTPSLLTSDTSDRPAGLQVFEILTVANYDYFRDLQSQGRRQYLKKKKEIVESIFDVIEDQYIPNFRRYLSFKISGSPTTNEHFCLAPLGNSYGSNMTPKNIGLNRLSHDSSMDGLYFCNASAGFPGFAGSFWNGRSLYNKLCK